MHRILAFLSTNKELLLFGILLTFFSSYGQTFLISLYIPKLEDVFSLSNTGLSSFYAMATMASAFSLPWIGRLVDTMPLRKFTLAVVSGLILACLILSLAVHPILVVIGFYGLRLFGQGLMSHTAITTMARAFVGNRGKAISLATLGHPIGEAILPLVIALGISAVGWRMSLQISGLSLLVFVLPLVFILLCKQDSGILFPQKNNSNPAAVKRNPLEVMKNASFWTIAPAVFMMAFLNTAILYYQIKLGNSRGWEPSWVAGSLSVFATVSAFSMMGAGYLVDRLTARRLFAFMMIPYVFGLVVLAYFNAPVTYPIALAILGISNGAGSTINNALFAEIFGTEVIGSVRSVFTTVMVFSTALGPLSFGLLLDNGWDYAGVFWLSATVLSAVVLWSNRIWITSEVPS